MREKGRGFVVLEENGRVVGLLTERDIVRLVAENVSLEEKALTYATTHIMQVREDRDVLYALSLMLENNIRRLVVVDGSGRRRGCVTMQELLRYVEEDLLRRRIKVREVVGREFLFLEATATLRDAVKLMKEKDIGALPVLEGGRILGIITERQCLSFALEGLLDSPLKNLPLLPVHVVDDEAYLDEALKIMETTNTTHLVVLKEGIPAGVLSYRDVVKSLDKDYAVLVERKLRHTKDVLDMFPECVLEVLDVVDQQLVIWLNRRARETFGNLLDQPVTTLIPEEDWSFILMRLLKEGRVERVLFRSGQRVYELSASYLRVDSSEERGRIKMLLRDVSEDHSRQMLLQKELEVLKRVINNTEDMIIIYEANTGRIVLWNRAVVRKLGYEDEQLSEKTIYDLVAEDPQYIRHNIDRILRKGEVIRGKRHYRDIYGELLPVEIVATRVDLNTLPHILIVARDISERIKLERALHKRMEELDSIHQFLLHMGRCSSEEEAYSILAHTLTHTVGVELLACFKVNPSLNRIVSFSLFGKGDYTPCLETEPYGCKVFSSPQPFLYRDRTSYSCPLFKADAGSYLCMAVVSAGRVIALVSMLSKKEGFFTEERVRFVENIVNAFSPYVSNLRLLEITKELSIRDPLTNLYNRRFVMEFLERELERAKRYSKPLSVILADLDNFKTINDTYGHHVGDECLQTFAHVLNRVVRGSDVVGRYGGEEFILVLPETDKEGAAMLAERIRLAVRSSSIRFTGGCVYLTASFGVASFPEDGEDVTTLIRVADQRLYIAKSQGKDRVVW